MSKLLALLSLFSLLISCNQQELKGEGSYFSAVIGGEKSSGQFPAIVALVHVDNGVFCSGTIQAVKSVVTAAHCIDAYADELDKVRVYYGDKVPKKLTPQNSYAVKIVHRHPHLPAYPQLDQPRYLRHDLGQITIRGEFPIHRDDIPRIANPNEIVPERKVVAAGFGYARNRENRFGPLNLIGNKGTKRFKEIELLSITDNKMLEVEYAILKVDSGSGLLSYNPSSGKLELLGVASFIAEPVPQGKSEEEVGSDGYFEKGSKGYFAPIDTLANWLSSIDFLDHAAVATNVGNQAMAYQYFDFATRAFPENSFALLKKAQLEITYKQNYQAAQKLIDKLIELDPTHYDGYLLQMLLHLQFQEEEQFEESYYNFRVMAKENYTTKENESIQMIHGVIKSFINSDSEQAQLINSVIQKVNKEGL